MKFLKQRIDFKCECVKAGYCPVHKLVKSDRAFQICKGINASIATRQSYLTRWQNTPILTKTNLIFCEEPDLCTAPFTDVVKHLIYHILPWGASNSWVWKRNVKKLCEGIQQFNGKKIVSIMTPENLAHPRVYDSPQVVIEEFEKYGVKDVQFIVKQNKKLLGEVVSFIPMLGQLETLDPNHVVFYGHAKGITHPEETSVTHHWTDLLYETVYNNWDQVKLALKHYGIAGSFKRYGTFKVPQNYRWHYAGTFYWFRCASIFQRDWRRINNSFFGAEAWPAAHFSPSEAACLFHDGMVQEPYKADWAVIDNMVEKWRETKQMGQTLFTIDVKEYLKQIKNSNCEFSKKELGDESSASTCTVNTFLKNGSLKSVTVATVLYNPNEAVIKNVNKIFAEAKEVLNAQTVVIDNSPTCSLDDNLQGNLVVDEYYWNGGYNIYWGGAINQAVKLATGEYFIHFSAYRTKVYDVRWMETILAPLVDIKCGMAGPVQPCSFNVIGKRHKTQIHIQQSIFAARTDVLREHPWGADFPHVYSDVWHSWSLLNAGYQLVNVPQVWSVAGGQKSKPGVMLECGEKI